MRIEIKIKGVRETMNNIIEFEKEADRQMGKAMADVVFKVTRDAKEKAPFLTGHLRNNIIPNVTLRGKGGIRGTVTATAKYSAVQEFGSFSRGITGKRYMTRAMTENVEFAQRALGNALNKATLRARM